MPLRQNKQVVVAASLARTLPPDPFVITNFTWRGIDVTIDITTLAGGVPAVTVFIEALDGASGKPVVLLQSAALDTTGTTRLRVYPGIIAAANVAANDFLPEKAQVRVAHSTAHSVVYSIGATLMV